MPTNQPRINIAPTQEFREWLEQYAKDNHISSLSQALIELAKPAARKGGFQGEFMLGRGKYQRKK